MIQWERGTGYKKYKATVNGKTIQFGDRRYQQYEDRTPLKLYSHLDHRDKKRRDRYRARHMAIKNKDGYYSYKVRFSPAWFSYHYLW